MRTRSSRAKWIMTQLCWNKFRSYKSEGSWFNVVVCLFRVVTHRNNWNNSWVWLFTDCKAIFTDRARWLFLPRITQKKIAHVPVIESLLLRNSDENLRSTILIRKNRCLFRDCNDTKVQRHSCTRTCCCVDVSSKPCCNLYACSVTTLWGDWFLSNNCSIWNKALNVTNNSSKTNYIQRCWNTIRMGTETSIFQFTF